MLELFAVICVVFTLWLGLSVVRAQVKRADDEDQSR